MIVFDRSGSMSLDAGTGKTKIEEARDAASLFIQLVRASTGNRVGLVSFSTLPATPFPIDDVDPDKQGPPHRSAALYDRDSRWSHT